LSAALQQGKQVREQAANTLPGAVAVAGTAAAIAASLLPFEPLGSMILRGLLSA